MIHNILGYDILKLRAGLSPIYQVKDQKSSWEEELSQELIMHSNIIEDVKIQ